jgi:uncharacterized protein
MVNPISRNRTLVTQKERLILFGRCPVPGRTKTRLIPFLGPVRAAELQRDLTERTFHAARSVAGGSGTALEINFEGGTTARMRRWLGTGAVYSHQSAGDLGKRMETAFRKAFREGCRHAILFGTDIPGLSGAILKRAMDLLEERDLVIGPSTDGGYWLIGLKKHADLFRDVPWGSRDVLAKTLTKAEARGLSTALLEPLTDIDTMEDLQRLLPDWGITQPYLSVIIPTLDEAARIEDTVRQALCREAEVIVVDGGSGDGTREAAVRAGARLLRSRAGRGVQQNRGAEEAGGRVLLFLHADTLLPEDYVHHVFETLLERKAVLGAFRFKTDLEGPKATVLDALVNFRSRHLRMPYGDQALFMRKEVFQKTGGFRQAPIAEDYFFVRRVSGMGRTVMAKAAVTTSGRRWEGKGFFRTTLINQIILAGIALRISPHVLSRIYQGGREKELFENSR